MKKKLIEVALPLEAINKEAAREKSIRHGHPSTLHLWWARRPLAACRAVLFASLVDDPSSLPEQFPTEEDQDRERQRLFRLIEELVKWDNSNNKTILDQAHKEILKSTGGNPPPVYDPFCGGGSIPLEAQRLGLEAHASDLNPVAVLITKALIEIPPKFADQPPVNPEAKARLKSATMWEGARGLAEDIRYYGNWMRDRAFDRIGHLYPKVKLPPEQGGGEATVIAWLWSRTVNCPNPACGARMPLVRSFALSTKRGNQTWMEPHVDHASKSVSFAINRGIATVPGTKQRGASRCIFCGTVLSDAALRKAAVDGGLTSIPLAVVAEGPRDRIYLGSEASHIPAVPKIETPWLEQFLPDNARWFSPPGYGMRTYRDLFTDRQVVSLTTFSDLVAEAREEALRNGASAEYADAVATYLSFGVDKMTTTNCSTCSWQTEPTRLVAAFSRQAIPMVWDYAEANPFSGAAGDYKWTVSSIAEVLEKLCPTKIAFTLQRDAANAAIGREIMVSTDPPYYDNIGYADLSDYFYVWLRRVLASVYPDLFSTLLTPKKQELIASPSRFEGDKQQAKAFFEDGFSRAFHQIRISQLTDYPLTAFYAFKQSENDEDGDGFGALASTGWETMLEGLLRSGFQVTGTWPMRTELTGALKLKIGALASSIVLACRPVAENAQVTTRKDFLGSLKKELPRAVRDLQKGNIAPVDLAQAAIGPGMAVFSRYKRVLESDGSAMRVRTALGLINQTLDEALSEQESEFDPHTRWALVWFEQHGFDDGMYGEAEVLATAKALSVTALAEADILNSRAGKVRLLRRDELPDDWNPSKEHRLTVWSITQHLIRALDKQGEKAAGELAAQIGGLAEVARDLAYRLYVLSERKGWAEEAGYYNSLVVSWPAIAPKSFELTQ